MDRLMHESLWLVEVELKRVQTYLFQVPRLRVMIGANALLGETLRGRWTGAGLPRSRPVCRRWRRRAGRPISCGIGGRRWPPA